MPVNTIAMPCSSAAAITSCIAHRAARLDDRGDAVGGGDVDAVAKREERVGRHDRAAHLELFVGRLERRDARGIHAAHLAGADADGGAVAREHDGVGLHELAPPARRTAGRRARARRAGGG